MTGPSFPQSVNALWTQFQESGDPDLLSTATDLLRAALGRARNRQERMSIMSNLAAVLQARSAVGGSAEGIRESIHLLREALASTTEGDNIRDALALNLAAGLHACYTLTGDTDALLECIKLLRLEVDKHSVPDVPATLLDLLSSALMDRYLLGGDAQELDEAVSSARLAVNLTAMEDEQLPSRLTTLASALSIRSEARPEMADLDSAITIARRALSLPTASDAQAARFSANLGSLLHTRFELTASETDLNEAITLFSTAAVSEGTAHASTLRNLGLALLSRFEQSGNARDIDEAIKLHERAVQAIPPMSPSVSDYLIDLGLCWSKRYRISGRTSDIRAAITAVEESVQRTPPEHPRIADYLFALAEARFLKYSRDGDNAAAVMAANDWRRAAAVAGAGTSIRLKAARSWAETAAELGDWTSAAGGYETAIGLLPALLWQSTDQVDRSSLPDKLADLPCDAAACMIHIGRPTHALEVLELGRGVLWRWFLGMPTDIDALGRGAPELTEVANALARIRKEIDHTGVPLVNARGGAAEAIDQRMALAREWDELVARVRSVKGFGEFLRAPRAERLLAVDVDGPVVVVNASRLRCDALVLHASDISVVPLPELTHDEAVGRLNEFLSVVSKLSRSRTASDSLSRERVLRDLLGWLWQTIAAPVLDFLGLIRDDPDPAGRLPRIWWCPTGPLAVLPLHAAGVVEPDGSLLGVLDYAMPSYTATVSQLDAVTRETANARPGTTDEVPLLVSLATTPGMPGLPTAARELEILTETTRRFRPTVLSGDYATVNAVCEQLTNKSWLHFSCHGAADIDKPWRSGIHLHDQRLSVADLAKQERPITEMVVLSSCETSAADKLVSKESVNLVAALQSMGAHHVVGALWSVRDESAAVVTDHLYRDVDDLSADATLQAAQRLYEAIMELRRANPRVPSVWACFAHYGP